MVLQKFYQYDEALYPPVLARADGKRAPRSRTIDPSYVQLQAGPDGVTQRIIPPGCFAASIPGSTKLRPLPRTRLTAAIASGTTDLVVTPNTARLFKSTDTADVLVVAVPTARAVFASTWANADTATLTIAGRSFTYTVSGYSTLTALASAFVVAADASGVFSDLVTLSATAQSVYVFSKTGTPHTIASSEVTAGTGTFSIADSNTFLQRNSAIGTVASIDVVTHTITLESGASALPAGTPIAAQGATPYDENGQGWGMISPNQPVDLEWSAATEHGLWISGTVYRDRLPYWDGELAALFPELIFD